MKLTLRLVAGVLVVTGALAGCDRPPGARVATADHATTGHTTTGVSAGPSRPAARETDYDKALRYTRCMTANGAVTPDPVTGKALVTVNIIHVGDSEATLRTRQDAFAKCRGFLPATWPLKEDPADAASGRPFRDCVRKEGVAWPEPDADGIAAWPTDPLAMATPAYNAAIRVCRHLLDDPANNLPENQ